MFFFVHGLLDLVINLVDLFDQPRGPYPELHKIRQTTLDFHQDYLQLLHLLVEKEQ